MHPVVESMFQQQNQKLQLVESSADLLINNSHVEFWHASKPPRKFRYHQDSYLPASFQWLSAAANFAFALRFDL
eukprot:SAG31_NODE_3233_length_4512_cov_72.476773_2_plen_74_part_00